MYIYTYIYIYIYANYVTDTTDTQRCLPYSISRSKHCFVGLKPCRSEIDLT